MTELATLLGDSRVGTLRRDRNGRISFGYDEAWRQSRGAYPLSLSMPLTATRHDHGTVDPFLWGLLPDNERVLDRWAKEFHVSARSAFIGHSSFPPGSTESERFSSSIRCSTRLDT